LFWYVYHRTVRIADISKMVPMVFGINLNWRRLGVLRKAVASAITILATASTPKYTTRILFLREMAHILSVTKMSEEVRKNMTTKNWK